MDRMIIGNLELCQLPDLGITDLEVRVDTGAKTSSLHVDNIRRFRKKGKLFVEFDLHPDIYNLGKTVQCSAPVVDSRKIKSSNGVTEQRYVIQTTFALGGQQWPIEITLTNRQEMSYLMLLGREGMGDRVFVDPSRAFTLEDDPPQTM
ncbi:ribosomal protein S6 modification protein [Vibrio sp. qd031]|uniref:ATP-dependent zinc protease family protein n=1 Tax=Vibrio sp. qd031 TaxID=1603038 RepID=UPI000A0FF3C9|nr:ATP-dependent zinc protease [Vibrio sp. qd031]ORT49568.1 ribosomal protein S6 modification protein [Vibrio sp. qd031]